MNKKGFTLLELLVVVLIIGILASIALPQYEMAVTKAKVASMLPLMRRWKDALAEFKLQHGSYCFDSRCNNYPVGSDLGVSWPSDWGNGECGDYIACNHGKGGVCSANEMGTGTVMCDYGISDGSFAIVLYQPDETKYEDLAGMITCEAVGTEAEKVCKALGGKLLEDVEEGISANTVYKLN